MDLLQTIFSNNKLVAEAVEQTAPVLRRLSVKIAERLAVGGRIFCLGGTSPVPGEYGVAERFFAISSESDLPEHVGKNDIFIAVDNGTAGDLAVQMRAWRRRGMLTACICCDAASSVASASEIAVKMTLETAAESHQLKVRAANQMALDALLTLALAESGAQAGGKSEKKGDGAMQKAVSSLMKEIPAIDNETAEKLIQRYGSVKKAVKAYNANV